MTTVKQCLDWARQTIRQGLVGDQSRTADTAAPSETELLADARILLAHIAGKQKSWIYAWPNAELDVATVQQFNSAMQKRLAQHPVAYLTGQQEFWSLPLSVTPAVLIPRADTELLVEQTLQQIAELSQPTILELGTGSGAISIAVASERKDARLIATDISAEALQLAQRNAQQNGIDNIEFHLSDWFEGMSALMSHTNTETHFDIIVSNPPYIAENDPHLAGDGVRHEPAIALISGEHGTDALNVLIANALSWLKPDGCLLLEHGYDQGSTVHELLRSTGYTDVDTLSDAAGNERISKGCKPS